MARSSGSRRGRLASAALTAAALLGGSVTTANEPEPDGEPADAAVDMSPYTEGAPPGEVHHYVFRQQVHGSTPLGIIQVGSPPVDVSVIMDTGSEKAVLKTWATLKRRLAWMDGSWPQYIKPTHEIYNAKRSKTYQKAWVWLRGRRRPKFGLIAYGSGLAMTRDGYDEIHVGGRSLDRFPFSEILADSLRMLHTKEGAAGILGLQHMKNRTFGVSVFTAIRDMGKIYSFGYCRDHIKDRGVFTWGDRSAEGHALDVLGQIHWAVNLSNVSIPVDPVAVRRFPTLDGSEEDFKAEKVAPESASSGGRLGKKGKYIPFMPWFTPEPEIPLCVSGKCVAIIDTGSNIISGPTMNIMALSHHLKVKYDCSNMGSLPDLRFTLGDKNITIPPRSYVMKIRLPQKFAGASGGGKSKNPWAAAFEEVKRVHGYDLLGALGGDSVDSLRGYRSVCIPALVPLDAQTQHGDLWVVGTPLFDNYYTRWAWPYGSTTPQIFVHELDDAKTCKGTDWNWVQWGHGIAGQKNPLLNVDSETNLDSIVRSDPEYNASAHNTTGDNKTHHRHLLNKPMWKVFSHQDGDVLNEGGSADSLVERDLSDISYPHWAKHLTIV